ncbi:hypothetical protein R6Z07F_008255 [Ovis aries]
MRLVIGVTVFLTLGVRGVDVEQSPPALSLQEGASYTLRCNFSTFPQSVNWYLQNPGGRIIHLFYIPSGTKQEQADSATLSEEEEKGDATVSTSVDLMDTNIRNEWTTDKAFS